MQVEKQHLELDMKQQIRKGVCQGYILSSCLFNLYTKYIMWNAGLDVAQAGIKIAGRNFNNLRYTDDTTLMAESEELKSLLMKVKEESEKVGLHSHQDSMVLAQRQKYRSMEHNRKPRDKSTHLWTPYFDKGARLYNGEKTISLTSGADKTGQPLVKEWN